MLTGQIITGAATTTGRRSSNQDVARTAGPWFVVADGVGGHQGGEEAAVVAADTFVGAELPTNADDVSARAAAAHRAVVAAARTVGATDMATTIVGAVPYRDATAWAVFHVGDSRCYRFADGTLSLLTRDHSLVEELLAVGRLHVSEAADHPNRHVVTRALGIEGASEADVAAVRASPMRLLLCTDGVSNSIDAADIGRTLAMVADPQAAADRLIELAGDSGDNATALIVDVEYGR